MKTIKRKSITPREGVLDMYLNDIRKAKPNADKEKELFKKYYDSETSPEDKKKAYEQIITMNLKFVITVAKNYANNDTDLLEDLVSQGNIGMMEAFPKYDPESGNRFCTFASHYIKRSITNYLADENLLIRPTNNMRITPKVKKIEEEFEKDNQRKPTVEEVEDILLEQYGIVLSDNTEIAPVTIERIDTPQDDLEENDDKYLSRLLDFNSKTSVDNEYDNISEKTGLAEDVKSLMSVLSEREAEVVKMAFGMDGYLKEYKNFEIGDAIDRTPECARQILKKAMEKLRCAALSSNRI